MSLILDSLEIKNFRAFKHLRIEKLGRVNLIVGKNNVGKTSLLEALWLYACKGEPQIILQLLRERDELKNDYETRYGPSTPEDRVSALKHLFYGRIDLRQKPSAIEIGPVASDVDKITIGTAWPEWVDNGSGSMQLRSTNAETRPAALMSFLNITVDIGTAIHYNFPLDQNYVSSFFSGRDYFPQTHVVIVSADGLTANDSAAYWDNIVLSDLQHDVIVALKIIAPATVNVNLVDAKNGGNGRIPILKTQDFPAPVPLRSMGEGMNRMFGIALALVNAKDGMLLIDEVDTGLHYSVLPDLWKLIFEVAHRLNVQVFATSHSWDCIQAFQQAAADNEKEEGVLIRLENRKAGVGAVTFDEDELAIVTREQIEVR